MRGFASLRRRRRKRSHYGARQIRTRAISGWHAASVTRLPRSQSPRPIPARSTCRFTNLKRAGVRSLSKQRTPMALSRRARRTFLEKKRTRHRFPQQETRLAKPFRAAASGLEMALEALEPPAALAALAALAGQAKSLQLNSVASTSKTRLSLH